jgi:DNA-binding response OmpR family regulator
MADEAKRVVIVDDEEDVVLYLASILSDNGFDVRTASNGRDGLKAIRESKPHLICLDILMPGETGVSLYRKIREDKALEAIPVLIISGINYYDSVDSEGNGARDGVKPPDGFMEKPVKPEQFLGTVRDVIG